MSSTTQQARPIFGRLIKISMVCAALFFGVTGFIPIEEKTKPQISKNTTPQAALGFSQEVATIMSHNLVVNTEQTRCLALNIYWEARSEPLDGKLAVAGVTMNRVANKKFPNTICEVVTQRKSKRLHRCQFSWQCDGLSDEPQEKLAWAKAQQLARLYLAGIYTDPTGSALWYHADYVNPPWASAMTRTTKIGRHIFYKKAAKVRVAAAS